MNMYELARKARANHTYDWYKQRNEILKVIEDIFNRYPKCYQREWLYGGKINLIAFKFEGEGYFWWDAVNGNVIESSGFEKVIGNPISGKLRTEVIWNSDPDDHEPMVPNFPVKIS